MPFSKIKTDDADLDRVQQNCLTAFNELFRTDDHNVTVVAVSKDYSVTGLEDVVGILAGTHTITLQPPGNQDRKLTITSRGGTAFVVTGDNKFGADVSPGQTKSFVPSPDKKTYWVL